MHRMIAKTPKGMFTDHKDGDRLNNQKNNLRVCTISQNCKNYSKPITNTSGYKGVSWEKPRQKWKVQIKCNTHKIHIGLFVDIKDAALAYNQAALLYHGEFAHLNIIS